MEYRGLYISATDDCGENLGGYYCQVYADEMMSDEIDDFYIHPDELEENPDVDYWIRRNIDGSRHYYVEDGIVPDDGLNENDTGSEQAVKPATQRRSEAERAMSKSDFIRRCFRELLSDGKPHRNMEIVAYTREQAMGTEFEGVIEQNNLSQVLRKEVEDAEAPYTRLRFGVYQKLSPEMMAKAEAAAHAESVYDVLDMAVALQAKMERAHAQQTYLTKETEEVVSAACKSIMEHMDKTIDCLSAWIAELDNMLDETQEPQSEAQVLGGMSM